MDSQKLFTKPLKIIINDEAHRTAGVQKLDETGNVKEISVWQKTHDNDLLNATYRLYLTATPRIFSDKAKDKLAKARKNDNASELLLFSMDDKKLFGKEIYSLRFSQAIDLGLLSDFRVIISYINEKYLADYTNKLTQAQESSSLTLENAGKMVAFTNAMKKRNVSFIDERGKQESYTDTNPMRKALAFHSKISDSTRMAGYFNGEKSVIDRDIVFTHIDGKDNASTKSHKLAWLSEAPKEEARVLSNAKCLTEGIDVPSLDAVCFFDKRDSVVDVVQAVGRAIRKSDGKKYGYIILPLVLSDEEIKSYDKTLKGDKFKIVWQTLKALRSHDERLIDEARINEVVSIAGGGGDTPLPQTELFTLSELFNEMKNAVPKNLGDLQYWENYASKVGDIMQALILRIQALLDSSSAIQKLFSTFCKALQGNLNASFNESEAIALVAQHIITKPIFECIFPSLDFTTFDKVSAELEKLHTKLLEQGLNAETKTLEKFYISVRQSAEYAKSDKSKQSLIKNLYDTLFKQAFKKTQEKLGIVYTPIEGVDFIIHSTQYLLQKHFGKSLGDEHIHIADPFVGTGTFITRLIQSGYLDSRLESKFVKELWANEITLLGYYIAQINIATTYHERLIALGDSASGNHSADFGDLEATADSCSAPKSPKNYESPTANLRILEEEKQARRGNPKNTESSNEAKNLSEQAKDSRICDEKSGLCEATQGRALGVRNRSGDEAIADLSRKAQSSSKKPTPEIKLFDNLLFTDTFNTYAPDSKGFIGSKDGTQTTIDSLPYLEKNYAKIQEFKNTEFKIFMSNPPYSAGQKSANDDNANEKSPHIDKRISETYRARSLATSTKNTSFDSFKRALRFMSDRIGESGGIIGLVMNASFLDSNSDDGLRACLADEFDYIYIFNLRGNQRTSGETSRKEGGKFFDSGSRTPVAICFFVKLDSSMDCHALPSDKARNDKNLNDSQAATKVDSSTAQNPSDSAKDSRICDEKSGLCESTQGRALGVRNRSGDEAIADLSRKAESTSNNPQPSKAKIYYYDIGDYLSRQTKLNIIQNFKSIESMESKGLFTLITPNKDYDWINQRDYSFMAFTPMGSTGQKLKPLAINAKGELELEIFELFSQGVVTGKDNWSFNFSKENLAKNIALCIDTYNTEREALAVNPAHKLCNDLSKVTWSGSLDKRVRANRELAFDESRIRICSYRPFTKEFLYFDNGYNHSHCQMDKIYPFGNKGEAIACINGDFENVAIQVLGVGATHHFSALASNGIVDLEHISKGHCFPLYYYERVESSAENGQMTMDYDLVESMDCHAENNARNDGKKVDSSRAYYRRKDAIRDEALAFFQTAYNDSTINKEAMFYYIYAILNHPAYITKYKDNLSKMLPRIPLMQDFWGFVASGRALAQLHLEYESFCDVASMSVACGAFACLKGDRDTASKDQGGLFEQESRAKARQDIAQLEDSDFTLIKPIHFLTKGYKHTIIFNDKLSIVNIPAAAHRYQVNGKSAIEWILDRYKISTDKASGIVNDPNLYESTSGALSGLKGGRYVCALLLSVIEMSVRTSEILESMPEYKLLESLDPIS
ncbi:helicase-related protein [Helicobacter sp. XJK30-2]|uniref:Helicase-related protein n=1 Tax=Helicobacter zhangjianzhongii TaxID=2974574 RepID=A0ACC6FPE9_9HELI|nr:type ISP restriction/modification enzyme [Helicobacter sp. XJK30-2]MDL0081105.1 helicase-related protein [Helicobacter sp. XJK30-2]